MRVADIPVPRAVKKLLTGEGVSELFPPQEEAIKAGALEGQNLVLASPTASGKTLIAELCMTKHILERGGKTLYLTPLRALASEKYSEFTKYSKLINNGQKIRIALSTGDYDSSDQRLSRYDIIITTNEKADSLLRHRSGWISDITLVVADEIHLLSDSSRGPTLEVTLTKLRETLPNAQYLALSATVKNAEEVAEWLNAKSITTEWRPVKLIEGVYLKGSVLFNDGTEIKIKRDRHQNPSINLAMHVVQHGGQALVFANTRRRSVTFAKRASAALKNGLTKNDKRLLKSIQEKILETGERTRLGEILADVVINGSAFHHAGLSSGHRKIVEDSFRQGTLKIISATPTLAAGVNLPSRMVVISSYERYEAGYGRYPISVLEYKQMAGRAGRPKYDNLGESVLISKTEDERDYLLESYIHAKPERLWSKLALERTLRAHVLATLASGFAQTEEGVYDFFEKTFHAHQYGSRSIGEMVTKVLRFLLKEKMIEYKEKYLRATTFGSRISELYVDPLSAVNIRDGLAKGTEHFTDLSFLHLLSHTPDISPKFYPRSSEFDYLSSYVDQHSDEFMISIEDINEWDFDYEVLLGELKCALVLEAWINEMSEEKILESFNVQPGDLHRLVETGKWLIYTMYELSHLFGYKEYIPKILELQKRIQPGVTSELLPLVGLRGIGRVRGRMLFNAGYKTIGDLKRASLNDLIIVPSIGSRVARSVKEQVGGLVKMDEWERIKSRETEQKSLSDFGNRLQ